MITMTIINNPIFIVTIIDVYLFQPKINLNLNENDGSGRRDRPSLSTKELKKRKLGKQELLKLQFAESVLSGNTGNG